MCFLGKGLEEQDTGSLVPGVGEELNEVSLWCAGQVSLGDLFWWDDPANGSRRNILRWSLVSDLMTTFIVVCKLSWLIKMWCGCVFVCGSGLQVFTCFSYQCSCASRWTCPLPRTYGRLSVGFAETLLADFLSILPHCASAWLCRLSCTAASWLVTRSHSGVYLEAHRRQPCALEFSRVPHILSD